MIDNSVMISGAADDKRAHIRGVYFERFHEEDNTYIRMVSTDGSRLSTTDYRFENKSDLPTGESILIPKKGLQEVAKFLDTDQPVQLGIKGSYFVVKKEKEILIIRLLEGEFPHYADIIRKENGKDILLNKHLFSRMLKRMSILSSDNYKGAIFNFDNNELVVTATNPDIGEAKEDMVIEYDGKRVEIAFNPKFFIDTLSAIDEDNVILNITDEEKPCLIQAEEEKNYLSVIMPMRI